jgi:hypothetical protein
LLDVLKKSRDFEYFRTEHARKRNSHARRLVESASGLFKVFDRLHMAKILLLAIYLGGSTLERFTKVLIDKENKHILSVQEMLKSLLMKKLDFDDNYAKWLPEHLEHLNHSSLDILEALNPNEFEHVRFSTVVSISNVKERRTFDLNMISIVKHAGRPKRNIMEKAILVSQAAGSVMSLQ